MIIKVSGNKIYEIYRENGKKVVKRVDDFYPYFYIPEKSVVPQFPGIIRVESTDVLSIFGDKLKKVIVSSPRVSRDLKDSFAKTFEADVPYKNRYLIDRVDHSKHKYEYRVQYMDMEVDAREGFPAPEEAKYPITVITVYDSVMKEYFAFVWRSDQKCRVVRKDNMRIYYFDDEKKLIAAYCKFLTKTWPEIITGWNIISFDYQYIINRMLRLNMKPSDLSPYNWATVNTFFDKVTVNIEGIELLDMMQVYIKFQHIKAYNPSKRLESYSLKAVSEYEDIGTKYELEEGTTLADMWIHNLDDCIEYNRRDVELLIDIEAKLKLFDFIDVIKSVSGGELSFCLAHSKLVDMYILRKAKKMNIVLPTANRGTRLPSFEGAMVLDPVIGLHPNVASLDFTSYYPSIIQTLNLSPEVKNVEDDGIKFNNLTFAKNKKGFMTEVVEELFQFRKQWKDKMQNAEYNSADYRVFYDKQVSMKVLLNSVYGMFGYANFRLADVDIAGTITKVGRDMLTETKKFLEAKGLKVILGDTDSTFVKFPKDFVVKDSIPEIEEMIDEVNVNLSKLMAKTNTPKNFISMEFERFYKSMLIVSKRGDEEGAKKKYAGLLIYDDKFIDPIVRITGFEGIRRDTPRPCREVLNEFYFKVLNLEGNEVLREFLFEKIEMLKKTDLADMGFTIRISRPLDEYKVNAQHIRAAKYSNKHLNMFFKRTDYVKVLFVKKVLDKKLPPTDVVAYDDLTIYKIRDKFEIDYYKQLKRTLLMKVESIADLIGLNIQDIDLKLAGQAILADY